MPGRGRSSFTKRQKEHTRQQKQRDKAERRIQRKDEPSGTPGDSSELDAALGLVALFLLARVFFLAFGKA